MDGASVERMKKDASLAIADMERAEMTLMEFMMMMMTQMRLDGQIALRLVCVMSTLKAIKVNLGKRSHKIKWLLDFPLCLFCPNSLSLSQSLCTHEFDVTLQCTYVVVTNLNEHRTTLRLQKHDMHTA